MSIQDTAIFLFILMVVELLIIRYYMAENDYLKYVISCQKRMLKSEYYGTVNRKERGKK